MIIATTYSTCYRFNVNACDNSGIWYLPLDMPGTERTVASPAGCQQRCKDTAGCMYFNSFSNGGCHITTGDEGTLYVSTNPTREAGDKACIASTSTVTTPPSMVPVTPSPSNSPSLKPTNTPSPSNLPSSNPTLSFSPIMSSIIKSWTQVGQDIDGEASSDYSGYAVSLSADGTILAIGAYLNDGNGSDSGHVRVFQLVDTGWTQIGQDINGEAADDRSGCAVSLSADGTVLAIGAYLNDGNGSGSGHVRVFQLVDSSSWTQIGQDINGEASGDISGWSVSLSADGTILAIGAPDNDGNGFYSGHVRVFQLVDSSSWTQIGQDINGEATSDYSGRAVSLSADGTILAIGAKSNDGNGSDSGHVRVFQLVDSSSWTQIGQDINGEASGDRSGYAVSLSADGTVLAIGAYLNDGNGSNSGHVRVFQLVDSSSWTQKVVLAARAKSVVNNQQPRLTNASSCVDMTFAPS
eukprot:scaffold56176_cov23-Cyclotella_meneghiniana.AAC.1